MNRIDWHVAQLRALAKKTSRPLHLIVRGGIGVLEPLRRAFAGLTFVDTGSFVKAQRRQRISVVNGQLVSQPSPTLRDAPLDELIEANIAATRSFADGLAAAN